MVKGWTMGWVAIVWAVVLPGWGAAIGLASVAVALVVSGVMMGVGGRLGGA